VVTSTPNEVPRRLVLAGIEAQRGAAVAPTHRWRGAFAAEATRDLVRTPEVTGGYDQLLTPQQGLPTTSGTYTEEASYESLGTHMRIGLAGGDPGVGDGNATEAYTRTFEPAFDRDDIESATVQHGTPGLGWQSAMVMHDEWTLSWDMDDEDGVWKFSSKLHLRSKTALPGTSSGMATAGTAATLTMAGAAWGLDEHAGKYLVITGGAGHGQVRQVTSNTGDTLTVGRAFETAPVAGTRYRLEGLFAAGVPRPAETKILTPGTRTWIDVAGVPIGTTQVRNRVISASVTCANAIAAKWFGENEDAASDRIDRGARVITGQVVAEFDRRDEYEQWLSLTEVGIRWEKAGPVIDAEAGTRYRARVEVPRAVWETPRPDTRRNNITATFGFVAYLPTGAPLRVQTVTPVAALP
jgi:hypothetical protein